MEYMCIFVPRVSVYTVYTACRCTHRLFPCPPCTLQDLIASLAKRARLITDAFNSMEGVSCQDTDGAMYSFPKITLPAAFLELARTKNKPPDVLYCLMLLDQTGLSCVPGSGFRQVDGTYHFRTTILPGACRSLCFVASVL